MEIKLNNVTALWPKLNRPFRFDSQERRSVPCPATDDGAEYSINFELDDANLAELESKCKESWIGFAKMEGIKEAPTNKPYKQQDGTWQGKAKLKAAYGGEATKPPRQYDADAKLLPADFELTSGSKVNIVCAAIPYKTGVASGISLRLRAIQVVELAAAGEGDNPFSPTDGYKADFAPAAQVAAATELYKAAPAKPAPAPIEPLADDDIPF